MHKFQEYIETQNRYERLGKQLKKAKDDFEKSIDFKVDREYYFISENGYIKSSLWKTDFQDLDRFGVGNAFRTKQEAESEAKRRNLLTRFRAFRDECNDGWKPDFGEKCNVQKYLIGYSWCSKDELYKLKTLELGASNLFNQFGYFKSREDCDKAVELFGDEIKKLFVDSSLN